MKTVFYTLLIGILISNIGNALNKQDDCRPIILGMGGKVEISREELLKAKKIEVTGSCSIEIVSFVVTYSEGPGLVTKQFTGNTLDKNFITIAKKSNRIFIENIKAKYTKTNEYRTLSALDLTVTN